MKKMLVFVLAIMLVSSMTVPAYAYSDNSAQKSSWTGWFSWWNGFGSGDKDEPVETEPALAVPEIQTAKFYHVPLQMSLNELLGEPINVNQILKERVTFKKRK